MSGSTSKGPAHERSKAKFLAKIASGEIVRRPPAETPTAEALPRWVKTALIQHAVDGGTWDETARGFNRTGATLSNYAKSPGAKEWLATLEEFLADPVAQAKAMLGANALGITVDRLLFLHMAKEAGDYEGGDKIARDLQDRLGIVAKKSSEGAVTVKINLGGSSLEVPAIEAEYELVEESNEESNDG